MRKEEFFDRLEYLLQDIPEEDKKDALDYYRDYLDEAGPEREEDVLEEFGSPERVASIIRTDLLGGMEQGGEFTESGYRDERFERNEYPAVQPPKAAEKGTEANYRGGEGGNRAYRAGSYAGKNRESKAGKQGGSRFLKFLLILLLICIASPLAVVLAAVAFAGGISVFGVLFAALVVLAILTFCGFVVGGILIVVGAIAMFADVWIGVALLGTGFMGIGCGFLLFICSYYFYGKFLPWLFLGIVNAAGGLFNRKKGAGGGKGERAEKREAEREDRNKSAGE